jgi:hypothetical protein
MRASFATIAILTFLCLPAPVASAPSADTGGGDRLRADVQREIDAGNTAAALALLQAYLDPARSPQRPGQTFWAIDRVAWIQMGVMRDPAAAIAYFGRLRDDARLSDIDRGAIGEWIAVAEEWKAEQAETRTGLRDATTLFDRGKRYFQSGLDKTTTGIPSLAGTQFELASGYLRRFAILHPKHPRIGDVLYMLGTIRFHSRDDESAWSDNFYLKESIRRFPHSELANRSYELLKREAGRAYKPPAMPTELAENLRLYQDLARLTAPPA